MIRAEILFAMVQVDTKGSLRSFEKLAELFPIMFADSSVAKKFEMHKDKLAYEITYGLGPFFQEKLSIEVAKKPYFAISFDESLNKVAQKGQMDIVVRFNGAEKLVETRYLTSTFLQKATAQDFLDAFVSAVKNLGLNLKKIIQVSMDGPNVNLKFLQDLKTYLKDEGTNSNSLKIVEFGTCGLHVVNGSYRTGHQNSGWQINQFLRIIYNLFKDFPSRRRDYIESCGSKSFPLKFCAI